MKPPAPTFSSSPVTPAEYARLRLLPGCLVYHSGMLLGATEPKPWAAFYRRPATGELFVVVDQAGQLSIRCFSAHRRHSLATIDLDYAHTLAREMARPS